MVESRTSMKGMFATFRLVQPTLVIPTVPGDDAVPAERLARACGPDIGRRRQTCTHGCTRPFARAAELALERGRAPRSHAGDRGLRLRGAAQAALHRARRAVGDRPCQPGGARPP